jgi:mono/diheme cytochrome c family protein
MIDSGDLPDGEELYVESCSTCHGTDGQGGIGPGLAGIADRMPLPDHIDVVLNGRGGMPNFSSTLDDETIAAIVAYEREGLG